MTIPISYFGGLSISPLREAVSTVKGPHDLSSPSLDPWAFPLRCALWLKQGDGRRKQFSARVAGTCGLQLTGFLSCVGSRVSCFLSWVLFICMVSQAEPVEIGWDINLYNSGNDNTKHRVVALVGSSPNRLALAFQHQRRLEESIIHSAIATLFISRTW